MDTLAEQTTKLATEFPIGCKVRVKADKELTVTSDQ